ncbi:hypothetical protein ES319_D08G217100v1 [Gossypium barbadense]|uniref:Uncharacterized protein n=2 Tax=Gossypium TaxID=3633 RepID=A0A5J5QJB7_GOSBA|nr:hypothetical protein ES319_D08G217100v1 [Gossypium barbadense]TYG58511.1 hypothetical protein ES288_D08G229000v1 [Gossypium darwinii]
MFSPTTRAVEEAGGVAVAKLREYVMGEQEADKMATASEPKVVQQPVLVSMDDVAEDKSLIPPIS